ncbi:jg16103 [Pararge aegeria aegeria]|uniref:Jg16103 protein n=1 Tax=Pararge aegeria aegeria TaxID=348720 RepID=A0A8S4S4C5_9NEOP|nr:jg16103 [Pararge aegeria aegeria]
MGRAHSSEKGWTLGSQGAGMAASYWSTQRWSTPNEVDRRLRIVERGTPYKRPMSSSGRLSVDVMMMMMIYCKFLGYTICFSLYYLGIFYLDSASHLFSFSHILFGVFQNQVLENGTSHANQKGGSYGGAIKTKLKECPPGT